MIPTPQSFDSYEVDASTFGRWHATDGPEWWCEGRFKYTPLGRIGIGHSSRPEGWPIYRCLVCGDEIFAEPPRVPA